MEQHELPGEIQSLLYEYRHAMSGYEPKASFMPELWARIDARRNPARDFGRLARGFVTAAAALTLALSVALWMPTGVSQLPSSTYIDVLVDSQPEQPVDAGEIALADTQ
jgi:hypothetical protein